MMNEDELNIWYEDGKQENLKLYLEKVAKDRSKKEKWQKEYERSNTSLHEKYVRRWLALQKHIKSKKKFDETIKKIRQKLPHKEKKDEKK